MGFRNIIITERCKLEYSLNYFVCRRGMDEKRILIDEIKMIIIQTTQAVITSSLLSVLSQNKIKLIICNEKHNPECEMIPYQNNFYSYRKIKEQIEFVQYGDIIWQKIVKEKIRNQSNNLLRIGKNDETILLNKYEKEVEPDDVTNREGHSAKVYFNALFGTSFNRNQDNFINKYLNYGYSIILSSINREIKSLGYLTELGIHHIGESNHFNLSCDLMEPLRPLVDNYVINQKVNEDNFKIIFIQMLTKEVKYNNQKIILDNAIHLYILNILNCLKDRDYDNVKFIEYEL